MQKLGANVRFPIETTARWRGHNRQLWVDLSDSIVARQTAGIGRISAPAVRTRYRAELARHGRSNELALLPLLRPLYRHRAMAGMATAADLPSVARIRDLPLSLFNRLPLRRWVDEREHLAQQARNPRNLG